jgi:hypothetical protein
MIVLSVDQSRQLGSSDPIRVSRSFGHAAPRIRLQPQHMARSMSSEADAEQR